MFFVTCSFVHKHSQGTVSLPIFSKLFLLSPSFSAQAVFCFPPQAFFLAGYLHFTYCNTGPLPKSSTGPGAGFKDLQTQKEEA